MRASEEIKTLQFEVKQLLNKYPKYREDDKLLSCALWSQRLGGKEKLKTMSAFDFLSLYAEDKMPNHDSITRASRKVKEDHPELRGKNYKDRQDEQKNVRKNLGYNG